MRTIGIMSLSRAVMAELDELYRTTYVVCLRTHAQMVLLAAEQRLTVATMRP